MIKEGEKMTQDVVEFIRRNTTPTERREIAIKHDWGIDILNSVLRRDRNVTNNTIEMFEEIIDKAKSNLKHDLKLSKRI